MTPKILNGLLAIVLTVGLSTTSITAPRHASASITTNELKELRRTTAASLAQLNKYDRRVAKALRALSQKNAIRFQMSNTQRRATQRYFRQLAPVNEEMREAGEDLELASEAIENEDYDEAANRFSEAEIHFGNAVAILDEIDPPRPARRLHRLLRGGLSDYERGSGLAAQGIRDLDIELIEEATDLLNAGARKLRAAEREIERLERRMQKLSIVWPRHK
jgi:tetratricopeptide (TPR) repeat protein